jgi:hypothetical protein
MPRREDFPGSDADRLPLEGLEAADQLIPRFDPDQHRAFGSIPGLIGKEVEVPPFHRLDGKALERVRSTDIREGLYGVSGNYAVNGLVLGAEEYTAIVRHAPSFQKAIQARITAANRPTNDIRTREKELRGVQAALRSKTERHQKVLSGLDGEHENLSTLKEWQHTPGFWRASETDIRVMASSAWESFHHMTHVLADHYDLSSNERVDVDQALAYRLLRGGQRERIGYWGEMLELGIDYNRSRHLLFEHSARIVEAETERTEIKLMNFYNLYGIQPPEN